mmetsp:Transcript_60874/g.188482  ORF Transcript_60874/g.188482 Transcript_60874/m.188482 type:complete len:370 (-) Transcript_60874:169-1278(-)
MPGFSFPSFSFQCAIRKSRTSRMRHRMRKERCAVSIDSCSSCMKTSSITSLFSSLQVLRSDSDDPMLARMAHRTSSWTSLCSMSFSWAPSSSCGMASFPGQYTSCVFSLSSECIHCMTPSQGTRPRLTRSPPSLTMPTIFSFVLAFLSMYSSSGRSVGISGVLRTIVRKMCWHFSQTQALPSSSGRSLDTKLRIFSVRSVYISVYWCCLLDASKMSVKRSSSTCLNWPLLAAALGDSAERAETSCSRRVERSCSHSLSNFSGVNLLMRPRHCSCGVLFFSADSPLLDSFLAGASSLRDLLDLPSSDDLHVSSPASRSRRPPNHARRGEGRNLRWAFAATRSIVVMMATRNIQQGEELFIDYGKEYWNGR